jgi:hypothetical protein
MGAAAERACRDVRVPLVAHADEEAVTAGRLGHLHKTAPPLVASSSCKHHLPTVVAPVVDVFTCTRKMRSPKSATRSSSGSRTAAYTRSAQSPPASSSPIARRHLPAAAVSKPIPCTAHMSWTRRKLPANCLKTATILWSIGEPLPSSHQAAGGRRSGLTGGTAELDREGLT